MIELNDIDTNSQRSSDPVVRELSGKTPPFRTESLERILGAQAEGYFRQMEKTLQVSGIRQGERRASMSGSRDRAGGGDSVSQNNSMHISLTLPGIAEVGPRTRRTLANHPRLSSADKK